MEHTKLPLTTWFLGVYLISQAKTGLSALALKRPLGVSYPTAWWLHHRINRATAQQDSPYRLNGAVQLNDPTSQVSARGGKARRGSENKVPFVAAVPVDGDGHPLYVKLNLISGFTSQAIAQWAKASLMPGTHVNSDALGCFAAVADASCIHLPKVVGALEPRNLPEFKGVNTVLGNAKTSLAGAFHALQYRHYGVA